jgi:cytochrome c peroxidase
MALATLVAASASLLACAGSPGGSFAIDVPLGLELYAPVPEGSTLAEERVDLGRRLFLDRALSADRTVSCSSCHRRDHSFADDVSVSPGVYGRVGHRNTPSLLNIAYARHLTWDGRSTTLEEQVLEPIQDPVEMDLSLDRLVTRLDSSPAYREAFRHTFGDQVTANGVALALAAYLRTLRSGNAPIDRQQAGDSGALTREAREGARLFTGKARCSVCHAGPMLTDGKFHNTGVTARSGSDDLGRYARTGQARDQRAFRTASLRNVDRTAPYMHDGSFVTLEEVVEFYNGGGGPDIMRDADLRPLRLSAGDKAALAAFLRSLGGA